MSYRHSDTTMPRSLTLLLCMSALCHPSSAFTAPRVRRSAPANARGCPPASASQPPLTQLRMNDHDLWWEERRARNRAAAQGYQYGAGPPPPPPPMMDPYGPGPMGGGGGGPPLDQIGLETLLVAFAESDFMAEKFRYYGSRINHSDRGPVFDVFSHASVSGGNVELELRDPFDDAKKVLLDRLAKYIRARYPHQQLTVYHFNRDGRDVY